MKRIGDREQNTHLRIVSIIKDMRIVKSVKAVPASLMHNLKVSFKQHQEVYNHAKVISIHSWNGNNPAA